VTSRQARLDSAFFSQEILRLLDTEGVEFTISVPFERKPPARGLKGSGARFTGLAISQPGA